MQKNLITINNCRIENSKTTLIENISWNMNAGEAWLVIGPNGGGKATFLKALAGGATGNLKFVPNSGNLSTNQNAVGGALYSNIFENSVEIVSLERAAALIEEERANDESEYTEGGVDHGRTARVFLCEGLLGKNIKRKRDGKIEVPPEAAVLQNYPEVKLCGIEKILDRGLKYMSTGEIRRTLLCRVLLGKKRLLILSDPFAGLDAESRKILLDFFDSIATRQLNKNSANENDGSFPRIVLGMERWHEIPDAINYVLEFAENRISFCGARAEYEKIIEDRQKEKIAGREKDKNEFKNLVQNIHSETAVWYNTSIQNSVPEPQGVERAASTRNGKPMPDGIESPQVIDPPPSTSCDKPMPDGIKTPPQLSQNSQLSTLVQMTNVNVGWDDHRVLVDLNWTLRKGEHWLIRGPNGSGKTTFLELITGDNMQVFSNDVKIFGKRRGSGETIWDIKKRLGIVSYRLHVEYRMVGETLLGVIISGFHDSIGLYEKAGDVEIAAAKKWLALGGFAERENESFNNLSYGEQRAVLILRAAVKAPEILILDEPCHGLDENFRQKILDLLETIAESGTTTLLHVTHDPTEALECEKHILEFCPNELPMYKIIAAPF